MLVALLFPYCFTKLSTPAKPQQTTAVVRKKGMTLYIISSYSCQFPTIGYKIQQIQVVFDSEKGNKGFAVRNTEFPRSSHHAMQM